ncbi:cell envelope integrity protein TolA, partial [Escherichia coli]
MKAAAAKAEAAKAEAAKSDVQKPEDSKPVAAALLNPQKPETDATANADTGTVTKTSAGGAAKPAKSGAAS